MTAGLSTMSRPTPSGRGTRRRGGLRTRTGGTVVTIGNFDGVHRGHQDLIREVRASARAWGAAATAVMFDPHPLQIVRPEAAPTLLTTVAWRERTLREMGIERVHILKFDPGMADWAPETFVQRVVVETLDAVRVVVGAGFRFGKGARGTTDALADFGAAHGFECHPIPLTPQHSSTAVRRAVAEGRLDDVTEMLGRYHSVPVKIHHRGRRTLHATPEYGLATPPPGSYRALLTGPSGRTEPAAVAVAPTRAGVAMTLEPGPGAGPTTLLDNRLVVHLIAQE